MAAGTFGGTIHVLSSDSDEGSFDIALTGHIAAPKIRINGSPDLVSGELFDLGTTLIGTPLAHTFFIHNVGDADLLVSGLDGAGFPAGFTLLSGFGDSMVVPGSEIGFTVQLDAAAPGTFGGTIHVLSNDLDTSSFDIGLRGVVTAPEIRVFASGVELTSGDLFHFTTVVGAPVTQSFTIQNSGDGALVLTPLAGGSLPHGYTLVSDFGTTTVAPGSTTTFTVQFDASAKGSAGGALHLLSSDADEASFDVVLSGLATAPEISVFIGSTEFVSGGTIDFGTTQVGTPITRIVTVTNAGNANLTLQFIDPSTLPVGFSLVSNLGVTSLAPGQSTTFTLRLDAAASGSPSSVIHLLNSDTDEGSFALVLHGVVNNPPPPPLPTAYVKTIDNGADGFTATGKWQVQNSKGGFEQDFQFANKAEKNDKTIATATWKFTDLAAGQYRVLVTAPSSSSLASDAPFAVFDGATLLRTVLVNQSKGAGEGSADGFKWQQLGSFTIQGGTLVVQLTNRADGHVVADA
ncbi:MAG TPA: choice-of-anchor D domain-containing protein, partial [Pirellulaceae bacterium]|nr:choice-of-anchor D domain-containing protein [Pirellulaceae bacterium]